MPLTRENRRRQITLNVTPYIYDVDAVALSLINQFKANGADPEVTRLDDYKLSLTFRESDELTYEVACQKILWNQYVQDIEQKNVTTNIEILKKMLDPYFDSPVVANVNEVKGGGEGQLDGISPSAFSDGEVLWADGKPMAHPSYSIGDSEVRVPAGGPMPLSRDLNKDAESSTITAANENSFDPSDYAALEDASSIHTDFMDRHVKSWRLHEPIKYPNKDITHISTWVTRSGPEHSKSQGSEGIDLGESHGQFDDGWGKYSNMTWEEHQARHRDLWDLNEMSREQTGHEHEHNIDITSDTLHSEALRRTLRVIHA